MEWVGRGVDSTILTPRMNNNQESYFYKLCIPKGNELNIDTPKVFEFH